MCPGFIRLRGVWSKSPVTVEGKIQWSARFLGKTGTRPVVPNTVAESTQFFVVISRLSVAIRDKSAIWLRKSMFLSLAVGLHLLVVFFQTD
jgi:hypothetical protein